MGFHFVVGGKGQLYRDLLVRPAFDNGNRDMRALALV